MSKRKENAGQWRDCDAIGVDVGNESDRRGCRIGQEGKVVKLGDLIKKLSGLGMKRKSGSSKIGSRACR